MSGIADRKAGADRVGNARGIATALGMRIMRLVANASPFARGGSITRSGAMPITPRTRDTRAGACTKSCGANEARPGAPGSSAKRRPRHGCVFVHACRPAML
ncbi:MAG: hypothetical protein ACREP0_00735, partial [Rhodanobacteraceae bacterium]